MSVTSDHHSPASGPASGFHGTTHREPALLKSWLAGSHEPAIEPGLPIVDAHHHLWDDQRGRYLADEQLVDLDCGHNVVATVYIEASSMYRADAPPAMQPAGEVEFVNGIAAASASGRYGKKRLCAGIVGYADMMLGSEVQPVLEALQQAGNGRLRGIRYGVCWDTGDAVKFIRRQVPAHRLADPVFRQAFARLAPLGLSFESWQFYHQLPDLVDLLRAFPHTSVILNHCGGVLGIPPHDNRQQVFEIWRKHIRELARFSNLTVKLGGLGMLYSNWDFHLRAKPPTSVELADAWRPYIETCIEAFGPDRCMMESNFPVDKQTCSYGVLWNAMKRITEHCTSSEKTNLYMGTAVKAYRLETILPHEC